MAQTCLQSVRPSPAARRPAGRRAFTLIELLTVISIIVLVLGMAVPAFKYITGSKSIAAAQNKVSAMLARARGLAIGLQRPTGVWFYLDPTSGRDTMAIAYVTPAQQVGETVSYLELDRDQNTEVLPPGVGAQLITNPNNGTTDKYIGYNAYGAAAPSGSNGPFYGGVILFDSTGRLLVTRYGFRFSLVNPAVNTSMYTLFHSYFGSAATTDYIPGNLSPAAAPTSQFGIVLVDRETSSSLKFPLYNAAFSGGNYTSASGNFVSRQAEDAWLDDNASPLLVGRYTGSISRNQ